MKNTCGRTVPGRPLIIQGYQRKVMQSYKQTPVQKKCPYTLEPSSQCAQKKTYVKGICDFTLEACAIQP